jgi:hypothetical protein
VLFIDRMAKRVVAEIRPDSGAREGNQGAAKKPAK